MVAPDLTVVPSASLTCSELFPMYVTVSVASASVRAMPAEASRLTAQTHSESARRIRFDVITIVIAEHESRNGGAPAARHSPSPASEIG
jgi:hypothetical protein